MCTYMYVYFLYFYFLPSAVCKSSSYLFIVYYRPSAIPGPVPDELVLPSSESIGLCQLNCNSVFAATVYYAILDS